MPRQRRLDAHLGRFRVAHLADEDHVGRLAEHGTDDAGEVEADVVADLDLVDPGEVVLDRILGRDDLRVGAVELVERGVERRRLAGARRAGDEDDAVGAADECLEIAEVVLGEAELADADADVVLVENPHDDRLAVIRGQNADAEIVVFAVGRELDAAVLRAAALGDVEPRKDLDAREDRAEEAAGRIVALDEPAVDPVADADAILERLDVDVAGPQLHRFGDDQIDELHHRRVGVVFLLLVGRLLDGRLGEVDGGVGEFLEHRIGRLAVAGTVMAVDRLDDLLARGQRKLDVAVEDEAELVLGVDVGRIGAGDAERVAILGDGEDRVFAGHALREEIDDVLLDGDPRQIDKLQPVGLR